MNTLERHAQAYENATVPRLDADFWLYRTLWAERGPIRATVAFWTVRWFGGWMYGGRRARRVALPVGEGGTWTRRY